MMLELIVTTTITVKGKSYGRCCYCVNKSTTSYSLNTKGKHALGSLKHICITLFNLRCNPVRIINPLYAGSLNVKGLRNFCEETIPRPACCTHHACHCCLMCWSPFIRSLSCGAPGKHTAFSHKRSNSLALNLRRLCNC